LWPTAPNGNVYTKCDYFDANAFVAVGAAGQIGLSYQNTTQTFLDGGKETNHRIEMNALYFF
jgi:hypothetical protein